MAGLSITLTTSEATVSPVSSLLGPPKWLRRRPFIPRPTFPREPFVVASVLGLYKCGPGVAGGDLSHVVVQIIQCSSGSGWSSQFMFCCLSQRRWREVTFDERKGSL